jgi:hypothetical protein
MYLSGPAAFAAGHDAAGVRAPALEWLLAEGATGGYFDEYILLANPGTEAADVQVDYLLPDGTVIPRAYAIAPQSRRTILVDTQHPLLANAAVSARLRARNGVPFVAERTMWWADGGWFESHNSPGATATGTRWLAAEGEVGGPDRNTTYVLIANTSPFAGQARATLLFEGGGTAELVADLPPNSRYNLDVGTRFPQAAGRRFAAVGAGGQRPRHQPVAAGADADRPDALPRPGHGGGGDLPRPSERGKPGVLGDELGAGGRRGGDRPRDRAADAASAARRSP